MDKKKKFEKSTKAEINRRVTIVVELLIQGVRNCEILDYFKTQENLDLSKQTIDYYISKGNKIIEGYSSVVRNREIGKCIRRYELIYRTAMDKGDLRSALNATKGLRELLGLDAVQEPAAPEEDLSQIAELLEKRYNGQH